MDHPAPAGPSTELFPPAEVQGFQLEDRMAASYLVGIMVGIFVIGLIGYIAVALWVHAEPMNTTPAGHQRLAVHDARGPHPW